MCGKFERPYCRRIRIRIYGYDVWLMTEYVKKRAAHISAPPKSRVVHICVSEWYLEHILYFRCWKSCVYARTFYTLRFTVRGLRISDIWCGPDKWFLYDKTEKMCIRIRINITHTLMMMICTLRVMSKYYHTWWTTHRMLSLLHHITHPPTISPNGRDFISIEHPSTESVRLSKSKQC